MINIALFGLGRIGQLHAKNLNNHPKINLKYIYDIDNDLSKKLSDKFKCLSIKNPKTALEDKNIDSIFIATSTPTHIKFITEAAKYKKVIFCEKPLDLDINKVNKCKKIIKRFKPKIQLGFNRRYDPGHNSLKLDLKNGKIGKLEKIIITSRDPAPPPVRLLKQSGTIFRDMMIHDFDLARFYLDKDEFDFVFATGSNISDKRFNKYNDFELATCVMKSKNGVQCVITNSRHCSFGYDQRVELFGSDGMIISDNKRELETKLFSKKSTNVNKPLMYFFIERYKEAYKLQLNDLVRLIKYNSMPLADFEDGRRSLILAEIAIKSLRTKRFEKIKY